LKLILSIFIFIVSLFSQTLQKVSIQLDWKYQFEFAGYIAAKEKGFYKDVGLDVKLVKYHNNDIVKDIVNGKYDFGVTDSTLIIQRLKGKPIKLIASMFKRSAFVIIVSPEIKKLKELENKSLMLSKSDYAILEFLKSQGVDIHKIKFFPQTYTITPFVEKKVDGFSAYITDQPYLLDQKHIKYRIINPTDYNALMYQGELFTTEKFAKNNPVLVDNFKKATIKGWEYALNHKEELAEIIYEKYSKDKTIDALLDEADKMETIIERFVYPIGNINRQLLEAQCLYEAKKLNKKIDVNDLLDSYIFNFQNPLNLTNDSLVLIKIYNCYLKHKLLFFTILMFSLFLFPLFYYFIKLNKEKKKIETLFEKVPVAYVVMNLETRVVCKMNGYGYNMFKFPKNKPLAGTLDAHINRKSYEKFAEKALNYIQENGSIEGFNLNWKLKKYTKEIFWANIKALKYSDRDVLWIVTDIDEIMKIRENLSKQIVETQKAMRVKEQFLANMSHEIRTPLNAILGFVDIIFLRERDLENKRYLDIMKKSGKQLLTIINDILDFSKIESGKLTIEKIKFNPKEEFETMINLFGPKAKEKNIDLQISFLNLKYNIVSDPTRIKQIIANLLSNAIKFTPENKQILCNINYNDKTEKLYIEVIDEGIGISEDGLKKIFKPFSQADNSTTRKFGGTGLGLTISKNLIYLLGGELKVKSEENKGSKFSFSLPAKKRGLIEDKKEVQKIKTDKLNLKKGKILIVEDNKANQMFLKVILKIFNLTDIDMANDGLEGIEKVKHCNYNLILMDENMPNMNGIEATKKIRELGVTTPIVAVTANALSGDRDRFLEAGMDDYISKPVDKDRLMVILEKYMEEK